MKKKILSMLIATVLLLGLVAVPAQAAGTGNAYLVPLSNLQYYDYWGSQQTQTAGVALSNSYADDLDDLYGWYLDPMTNEDPNGGFAAIKDNYYSDFNNGTASGCAVTGNTPMGFVIKYAGQYSFINAFNVNRDTRIGAKLTTGAVQITFNEGIAIENGTLMFKNETNGGGNQPMNTNIILEEPIVVNEGGSLIMENRVGSNLETEQLDTLVAPVGKPAIIVDGGTVHSGCFEIKRAEGDTSNTPLIKVNSGKLIFEAGNGNDKTQTGMPTYETIFSSERTTELDNGSSTAPAVVVASGAQATVKGANFTSSSSAPFIEVQDGATLVLDNKTDDVRIESLKGESFITANGENTPAILVRAGGTLKVVAGTENYVTATKYDQAIELESGAEITVGAAKPITVGGGEDAENYFDNDGIAVLAAGATMEGEPMFAALVLTDGTVVEGSATAAPTMTKSQDGEIEVTVPAGGKVTQTDGTVTQMSAGGSVSQTEDETTVEATVIAATGISLNKTSVTLYSDANDKSTTLIATLTPADTTDTVTWTSSDTTVATVDQNGVVTAVGNGQATITAQAVAADGTAREGVSATCTVTVSRAPVIPDPHAITVVDPVNGSIKTSLSNASKGAVITVTATPDKGYELAYITVDGEKITGNTFTMPDKAVTVSAVFVPVDFPFTDVKSGDWFYDYVAYVYSNGLMDGTSATTFEPNANMTRAMVWAILARIDGETVTGAYWADTARTWAMAEGVSDGTDPNGLVTREQFATMLYRYAVAKGYDVSIGEDTNILSYADFDEISEWAILAIQWACGSGIITGVTDATIVPQGSATRAQCAAMLMRFVENV